MEKTLLSRLAKAKEVNPGGQFTTHYDKYLEYQVQAAKKSISFDITEIRVPWWREFEVQDGVCELTSEYDRDMGNPLKPVGVNTYKYYVDNGYEYVIVHSYMYNAYFKPESKKVGNFPSFAKFYKELFEKGNLIKEFSPKDGNRPGPVVKIFQL